VAKVRLIHWYAKVETPSSAVTGEMMWSPSSQALEVTLKLPSSLNRPVREVLAGDDRAEFLTCDHAVTRRMHENPLTRN
jgi:hypothetical protein